jgi:hypothetical protein
MRTTKNLVLLDECAEPNFPKLENAMLISPFVLKEYIRGDHFTVVSAV